ncbi:MAG TPA: XdhC/CoxI family protein [Chitinophagaceae bacterium]|nr:XdhC/CoxI family protein [Chitinophagaceae bacterium]
MKELREIIKAYDAAVHAGKKSALAAVVHLDGSSYRRPGARMLVNDDGELTGAISGGCLEGDALRKALLVLSQQQSKLVTYDTNDEDDATIGIQLGCAGIIRVLFEPINPNHQNNPVQLLRKAVALRQKSVLVTLFSLEDIRNEQPGTCLLMEENGNISGEIPYSELNAVIMEDVNESMKEKTSGFKNYTAKNISVTAFIEFLQPAISLVVIGAGNDAIPMMQIADSIGWEVRVVDGRITHAKPERFVSACQVLVSKPEKVLEQILIDEQSVFVLMTHNYNYDLAMLKELLQRKVTYIGMLGPKKKLDRMLEELQSRGMKLSQQQLNTIYGPVGLEIGAETQEEIALSIIAEIKAVLSGKPGGSLRNKQDVIHSGTDTFIGEKRSL